MISLPVRVALVVFVWLPAALAAAPIIREAGAIYLSDFDAKPLKLALREPAPAYFDFAGTRYVGTLRFPQVVEVQAVSKGPYRVRGQAQQGQVLGWVDPKKLAPLDPDFLAALEKSEARRQTVTALIAKNEVGLGMTPDEVELSIGKPQKRNRRSSQGQDAQETWEYVKYANVPQNTLITGPDGGSNIVTTYVKTAIGRLAVTFKNGMVESLDQTEGTTFDDVRSSVVVPPVVLLP